MSESSIGATYAQALLEIALEKGLLDGVMEDAGFLVNVLREERDLRAFLDSPRLDRSVKQTALKKALEGKVTDLFLDFLCLTLDKNRQEFLTDMMEHFGRLCDEKTGIVRAEVTSSAAMSPEETAGLATRLGAELGKQVVVTSRVDPAILGGVIVRYNSMVADGSLKTSLEEVRASMLSLKFGSELVHED